MDLGEMSIAEVVVIVSDHFIRFTFETHTLIASTASNTVTTIHTRHWYLASRIRTLPYSIIQHVFLK